MPWYVAAAAPLHWCAFVAHVLPTWFMLQKALAAHLISAPFTGEGPVPSSVSHH